MEIWKDIKGYEGLFQVSSIGNVRSVDRVVPQKSVGGCSMNRKHPGKHRKAHINAHGYPSVSLCHNQHKRTLRIHRLVAEAFIDNPSNKPCVNHINGIKHDNRIENLEWVTSSENNKHAWDNGLQKITDKLRYSTAKVIINVETGIYYLSIQEAADSIGIPRNTLSNQLSGLYTNKTTLRYA